MQEENYNTLYVPVNIKTRFEFIEGFGFNELFITLIVSGIVGVIVFVASLFTSDPYNAILAISITAAATGMAVRKNEINLSITDMATLFWRFFNTQQHYNFSYYNRFLEKGEKNVQ